jgi:hypothetical protein
MSQAIGSESPIERREALIWVQKSMEEERKRVEGMKGRGVGGASSIQQVEIVTLIRPVLVRVLEPVTDTKVKAEGILVEIILICGVEQIDKEMKQLKSSSYGTIQPIIEKCKKKAIEINPALAAVVNNNVVGGGEMLPQQLSSTKGIPRSNSSVRTGGGKQITPQRSGSSARGGSVPLAGSNKLKTPTRETQTNKSINRTPQSQMIKSPGPGVSSSSVKRGRMDVTSPSPGRSNPVTNNGSLKKSVVNAPGGKGGNAGKGGIMQSPGQGIKRSDSTSRGKQTHDLSTKPVETTEPGGVFRCEEFKNCFFFQKKS